MLFLACAMAAPAHAAGGLALAGWEDAVDPAVLDQFSRETGIEVSFDASDDAESLEHKLVAGQSGYDLVFLPSARLEALAKAGALKPLEMARLPNAAGILPLLRQAAAFADPGNRFALPYMWGGTAFGIDEPKLKTRTTPLSRTSLRC